VSGDIAVSRTLWIKLSGALLIAGSLTPVLFLLYDQIGFDLESEFSLSLVCVVVPLMLALGWLGVLVFFWLRLERLAKFLTMASIGLLLLVARSGYLAVITIDVNFRGAGDSASTYHFYNAGLIYLARSFFMMLLGVGLYRMFLRRLPIRRGLAVGVILFLLIASQQSIPIPALLPMIILIVPEGIQALVGLALILGRYDGEVTEPSP
jgi:hypothetical protein